MKLQFDHVSKKFNDSEVPAINDVDLTLQPGVHLFFGKNGSGKSTLFRMLATVLTPTSGAIFADDLNLAENGAQFRARLGYLPQETQLHPQMKMREFLDYMARLKGISDPRRRRDEIDRVLRLTELTDDSGKKLGKFPGELLRRVGLAQAFLGDPDCVIIDGSTGNPDPAAHSYLFHLLAAFIGASDRPKTILVSTNSIEDSENQHDNLVLMDAGKLLYSGSADALVRQIDGKVWESSVESADPDDARPLLEKLTQNAVLSNVRYLSDEVGIRYIADTALLPNSTNVPANLDDAYTWKAGGVSI